MKYDIPEEFKDKLANLSDLEFNQFMYQLAYIDMIQRLDYESKGYDIFKTQNGITALYTIMWDMMPGNLCNPLEQVLYKYEKAIKAPKEKRWQYFSYHEYDLLNRIEEQKLSWYTNDCYKIFGMLINRDDIYWYQKHYMWYRVLGRNIKQLIASVRRRIFR